MASPDPWAVSGTPGEAIGDLLEELAGVGRWSWDVATGVLATGAAVHAILGWPSAGAAPTAADLLASVHPEDRARVTERVQQLQREGGSHVLEYRIVRPDGSVAHMHSATAADSGADGTVRRLLGITTDVTHAVRASQDADRDRNRARTVVASLSEAYLLSQDGTILEVNAALCALTGYAEHELVGIGTPYPFWPPEHAERLVAARGTLAARGTVRSEMDVVRRDGVRLRVAITAQMLPAEDGRPLWMALLRDVTAERAAQAVLEQRAAQDPLTGLDNSRTFREALRLAVTKPGPLSLALFDLDHFKAVNDRYGHAVGDEVLVEAGARLRRAGVPAGELARVGGEEFALLLPGLDLGAARRVAEAALEELRAAPIGAVGTVTASAGVAGLVDGMDDDDLYRRADRLLYEAKDRGRDQVR